MNELFIYTSISTAKVMSWKCDTCGVVLALSSQFNHLKSSAHTKRLTPPEDDSCSICKVKITRSNMARHNRSRAHIASVTLAEEIRQKNILLQQLEMIESKAVKSDADQKEAELTLDEFVVADCARYIQWMQENTQHASVYHNPRSMVYTVINNLYAAIACKDPTCAWWPQSFKLPSNARSWREDILHRSIGDVAMAESILLIAQSALTFESK